MISFAIRHLALSCALLLLLAGTQTPAQAQKADALTNLDRDLAKLRACYQPLNAGCVIDLMPPEIVAVAGGREALIALMDVSLKQLTSDTVKAEFDKVKHTPNKETAKLGARLLAGVQQEYPLRLQGKEGKLMGWLVAISTDDCATWRFADASARDALEQFYPGVWDQLKVTGPSFEPKP